MNEWVGFISANRDLADKNVLESWYDGAELKSEIARQTFVLPKALRPFP
jgi:hypothetical protein